MKLTKEQVLKMAEYLKNQRINEINKDFDLNNNFNNKGYVGHVIESYFGIKRNNISEPDIFDLGIEIKATPIKIIKTDDFSVKERMVLNIINFNQENLDDFNNSSFYKKNNKILMFFYLFDSKIQDKNYLIQDFIYHDLSTIPFNDLKIIKNDWKIITQKIKTGKAHELSERLTKYLGACPKGDKRENSFVVQPFSYVKAMRRAYSFKPHYLKYIFLKSQVPLQKLNVKDNENIFDFIFNKIKPFINLSINSLCQKFNIGYNNKQKHYLILKKIFAVQNFNYVDEFVKENIKIRTYTIKSNNKISEEFPFIMVNPTEFENDNIGFYDSELYNYFINSKFIFIGFKENNQGQSYISNFSFFEFPESEIKNLEFLWNDTRKKFRGEIVLSTKKLKNGNTININNLISKKDGAIGHIRPKAQDKNNEYLIPCGLKITRQCYWLNKEFVSSYFQELKEN